RGRGAGEAPARDRKIISIRARSLLPGPPGPLALAAPLLFLASLVLASPPAIAASPWTPHAGHLVIVGGGLDTGPRDPVLVRLGERARGGPVGVLSTASGVPLESGPETVQDFDHLLG